MGSAIWKLLAAGAGGTGGAGGGGAGAYAHLGCAAHTRDTPRRTRWAVGKPSPSLARRNMHGAQPHTQHTDTTHATTRRDGVLQFEEFVKLAQDGVVLQGKLQEYREAFR